jgi:putative ABC transport system substrate-binding protein
MRRLRALYLFAAAVFLLAGSLACAQPSGSRLYRVAILAIQGNEGFGDRIRTELAGRGYVSGRNLVFDERLGTADQMPRLTQELVAARPDVIVTLGGDALLAASGATRTVPIVVYGPDPISLGLAQAFARPGGNVTGFTILGAELDAKRLDLLHEVLPEIRRFAALDRLRGPSRPASERALQATASRAGLELRSFYADTPEEYSAAFTAIREAGIGALIIGANPVFYRDISQLTALAREARVSTICEWAELARAGCLIGYGPSPREIQRRVADFVDRILRGTPASDLPIEQPTQFELAVNLSVARALGVNVPASVLIRADEVIE